jgi:hypothetical protein
MSFKNCINAHAMKGFLTEAQTRDLLAEYDKLYRRYQGTMGDDAAAHMAAEHFVNVQQSIIMKKMENEKAHVVAMSRIKQELKNTATNIAAQKDGAFKGMKWLHGNPYARAVRDKLERTYERHMSLQREMLISIGDTVEKFRSKAGGFKQDVENFTDVVREAMGYGTGNDAAKAYGSAVRDMMDKLRQMYEDAGGVMGKIEGYYPVHHEPELVGRATFEEWRDFILPLLDRDRMVDLDTGLPFDDAKLNRVMRQSYENIKTNGLVDVQQRADEGLQTFGRGGEINMRRSQSRFFHFKDPEGFLEYNAKYGRGDAGLFDSLMDHISTMTRDIAIMQNMGPKPSAVMRNIELELQAQDILPTAIQPIKGMYDVLSGKNGYGGQLGPFYKFTMGWLNIKRAAYLGSAPISAVSDSFFVSLAAKMNGVPAMKTMGQYLKLLNPLDSTDRDVARTLFYVASAAQGSGLQGARFADDAGRGGIPAWLAGVTNRLSGLAAMTDAGRQAPMMIQGAMMARYAVAKTPWESLEPNIKTAANRYGITANDWDIIMRAEPTTHIDMEGAAWLMPENVIALGGQAALEAGRKYGDWMTALGNTAVNEPRLLTRTITTGAFMGDARQGSLLRLMAANAFFAKSFPVTVVLNHLLPSLRAASNGRGSHLAAVAMGSILMGAMVIQLRQIITGKEPRQDMDTGKFWLAAVLQGGGLGLFGDFLLQDYNRFGQSFGGTLAGPVVGTAQSLLKAGDLYGLAEGEWDAQEFAAETFGIASREIPGVNIWYSRLVVERMLLDQVEKMLDPKYDTRMLRLEKKMQKDFGQKYWWRQGEMLPEAMQ